MQQYSFTVRYKSFIPAILILLLLFTCNLTFASCTNTCGCEAEPVYNSSGNITGTTYKVTSSGNNYSNPVVTVTEYGKTFQQCSSCNCQCNSTTGSPSCVVQ